MKQLKSQNGVVLIGALITILVFLTLALAVSEFGLSHFIGTKRSLTAQRALSVAEAGAERFITELNADADYATTARNCDEDQAGWVTEEVFNFTSSGKPQLGKGVATVCWRNSPAGFNNEKVIESTGKVYLPASATNPDLTRKIRLTIRGAAPFNYGVQTGNGPLYIYGNVNFIAEIHVSDFMYIQDSAANIEGTYIVAGKNEGESNVTLANCSIYGNDTIEDTAVFGRYELVPSCGINYSPSPSENDFGVIAQPLPSIDKPAELGEIGNDPTRDDPCWVLSSITTITIGDKHYPEAGQAECNASLRSNAAYNVEGNIHIRGNLTVNGNTLRVSETDSNGQPIETNVYVIVESTTAADGRIVIDGNGTTVIPNSRGASIVFVSYSNRNPCGIDPPNPRDACKNNGSNNDPADSDYAITIKGNSLSLVANFLTETGGINYQGRGSIGSMAAQAIIMKGNGTTTFVQLNVGAADPTIWSVSYYQQIFK